MLASAIQGIGPAPVIAGCHACRLGQACDGIGFRFGDRISVQVCLVLTEHCVRSETDQEGTRHQFLTLSLRMLAQSGKHGTQKKAILRSSFWLCHYAAVHLWPDYHGASRRHLLSERDLY